MSQGSRNPRARNATKVAAAGKAANTVADDTPDYPGKRFGLPMTGPLSAAPMGRRLVALIVDFTDRAIFRSGLRLRLDNLLPSVLGCQRVPVAANRARVGSASPPRTSPAPCTGGVSFTERRPF